MQSRFWKPLFFLLVSARFTQQPAGAQTDPCKPMQAEREALQHKIYGWTLRTIPAEYCISLLEWAKVDVPEVKAETVRTDLRIKELQEAISKGAVYPGIQEELAECKTRSELMKLRLTNSLTNSQFFNLPKYKELLKLPPQLHSEVAEIQGWIGRIDADMKKAGCPEVVTEDYPSWIADHLDDFWEGNWKYTADPRNLLMRLKWTGKAAEGTGTYDPGWEGMNKTEYQFSNLRWNGADVLEGDFSSTQEEKDIFIDIKGKVKMTLAGKRMTTEWTETDKPVVRWKPGKEGTPSVARNPLQPYVLVFYKK